MESKKTKSKPEFELTPGPKKPPERRLSKASLKAEILKQERAVPIVLEQADYETWLKHTVLARMERGERSLDHVRKALTDAAESADTRNERRELKLALRELEDALIAFQYTALKANVMYRPIINGKEALNVILWPAKTKK